MMEWIQIGGLFLGVMSLCFMMFVLVIRKKPAKPSRMPDREEMDEPPQEMVLGPYTKAFAGTLPAARGTDLLQDLRSAGYYRTTAVVEYKAVRNLLCLIAALGTLTLALLVEPGQVLAVLGFGLATLALTFSLPRIYLVVRGRVRARSMERGLPLAIDMLILCLSAGQNLLSALLLVSRQLRRTNPVLAQELTIAHQQAELHSLQHALRQWADRVRLQEVRNLVMLLIQSEKLGADAAATLGELATNFRVTARQRAEAQANRTSFWMLFPSVFCFWVAAALILVGPAYLEYFQYQQRSSKLLNQSIVNIRKTNERQTIMANTGVPAPAAAAKTEPGAVGARRVTPGTPEARP
jgi:tight adherence protein C